MAPVTFHWTHTLQLICSALHKQALQDLRAEAARQKTKTTYLHPVPLRACQSVCYRVRRSHTQLITLE